MMTHPWLVAVGCLALVSVLGADTPKPEITEETLFGQVVALTTALSDRHIRADPESIDQQLVLRTSDGSLIPLLRDEASRAFFMDPQLRSRDAELHVRRYGGVPYVQVTTFKIDVDGTLRTPEYYCEVCSISVRYPQTCPCCQRTMEFRLRPEDR